MHLSSQAVQTAAGALQRISESTPGERGQRAGAVALVLRGLERILADPGAGQFLRRRLEEEVGRLAAGPERRLLSQLPALVVEGLANDAAELLVRYSAGLESARRLPEAEAVVTLARSFEPDRADLALHAARLSRLQGDRARALVLYAAARDLDGSGGAITRLAEIGEAVVAPDSERALGRAIRRAVSAEDPEAAAVGLEERARVRRARGDRAGAARDLAVAAFRFTDPVDRARVAHQLADLFVAADDPEAAREALLFALATGDRSQQDHARSRLHTVSRDLGDQLGMRRWRSFQRPSLVSLSSRPGTASRRSAAGSIARWRYRLERLIGSSSA